MNNLKLRAWSEKYEEMRYIDDLYFFEEEGIHEVVEGIAKAHHETYSITHYIGIKDVENKDIYKGDIVEGTLSDFTGKVINVYGIVVYVNEYAAHGVLPVESFLKGKSIEYSHPLIKPKLKIIGNIFEDLLTL